MSPRLASKSTSRCSMMRSSPSGPCADVFHPPALTSRRDPLAMCGRFTHRYSWADIHRLYRLTSPASNVQPSYNVCPTDTVNVVPGYAHSSTDALGPDSPLVVEAAQGLDEAVHVQRTGRDRDDEAVLPRSVQANSLHHSRVRLLRMAGHAGRQAAALLHAHRWSSDHVRGAVGRMERPRDRRDVEVLHDDHHRAERHGRGSSPPHASVRDFTALSFPESVVEHFPDRGGD